MATVLIVDASKPSLVMTSEAFKDKVPGTVIETAGSGKEAIEYFQSGKKPDLLVVDFDLPDADGPALVDLIRKHFDGPVLMTAYPTPEVTQAVEENLFTCNDARSWIQKPIKSDNIAKTIEKFLVQKYRIDRRYESSFETKIIGKAAGRGKRAPKVSGNVINLSIGGACVELKGSMKMKKNEEITMMFALPQLDDGSMPRSRSAIADAKVKATVAWNSRKGKVGLTFGRLSDLQKKSLEMFFRENQELAE